MSFFQERGLPELEIKLTGNNKDQFLDSVKSYIEKIEGEKYKFKNAALHYQNEIEKIERDPFSLLETVEESVGREIQTVTVISKENKEFHSLKSPLFRKLKDKIEELKDKLRKTSKEKGRAFTRAVHADKNMNDFLDGYVKIKSLISDDEYSIPHDLGPYIGEIMVKKGKVCFVRDKEFSKFEGSVEINGVDISGRHSNTSYLALNDEIKVFYDQDSWDRFGFEMQSIFKEEKITEDDLPDLNQEYEEQDKVGVVEGFSLDDD
jgi:hypothetical protein